MYSAYNLNKQGDSIQIWCTTFPIWNQFLVPCPVLTGVKTSLVAQMVKRLSTMWETWIRSLGREDSLEKEMATQYSCLENPMDRGAWCPWGHKELDKTERLHFKLSIHISPFNLHHNPKLRVSFPPPFYRWGNQVTELKSHAGQGSQDLLIQAAWL